jgi:hypothetical protein
MPCVHLKRLYELCAANDIKLSSGELVHVVCTQCGQKEVCPSMLMEEVEWGETHPPVDPSDCTLPATPVHPSSDPG